MLSPMPQAASDRRRTKAILRRLHRAHGPARPRRHGSGVSVLVGTILSQNSSGANSSAGYKQLWRRFRSWRRVADAPVGEIERCVRISGLSRIKAPRIRSILRQIRDDRGRVSLEFLADRQPQAAYDYLVRFDGVGPKTANCVLLFAFGMPVFPVDTHIHRIALRMELIPAGSSAERAHELLLPMVAPADRYEMHVLLIAHGRGICRARSPRCALCPLSSLCEFGRARS
jgi:endonuclease-3